MIKLKSKFPFTVILIALFGSLFFSCRGSYIFAAIENEIKLKVPTAPGTIRDVIKLNNGKLYASNGRVLTKSAFSTGSWSDIGNPEGICTGIATDGTTLFASFIDSYTDDSKGIYYYDGSWKQVPGTKACWFVRGSDTVFAATKNTGPIYTVTRTGVTAIGSGILKACGGNYYSNGTAVYNSDGIVYANLSGVIAIDNTGTYFLTANSVCRASNTSNAYSHGISAPSDMTLIQIGGKDVLLVSSRDGGYSAITVDSSDITKSSTVQAGFTDNVKQYESSVGKYSINRIFADIENATGYYIYLGVNDSNYAKYSGLWGYYSYENKEWNRE